MAFYSPKIEGQPVFQSAPVDDAQLIPAVQTIVQEFEGDKTRLMDIVLAVHQRYGHIPDAAVEAIASGVNMQAVEVTSMISFYAFLNREPKGRFQIRLCKTPMSLMKGAEDVALAFTRATGAQIGGVSPDGEFSLDWTSDIGMADQEPSALVNGTMLTSLTPDAVTNIVAALREYPKDTPYPLFPGADGKGMPIPHSQVQASLIQPGPIIFRRGAQRGESINAALAIPPEAVIEALNKARLRGRGGAGFPTSTKWKLCREAAGSEHYVVCNADEGEPGTFKDRVLLALAPDLVFDGMTVAAYAIGARTGLVYLRGEYAYLREPLQRVLNQRREAGLLGQNICGRQGFDFDIRIQLGAGAYICGEESALIQSLEGKRGAPRDRPPFPVSCGYLNQPTAVDNVETFCCAARIMEQSADWFSRYGTEQSTGTRLLSVSGDCAQPGVYEVPFGMTVNVLLALVGGTGASFVQIGGPSGECVAPKDYGRRIAFEDLATGGSVIIFGPGRNVLEVALQFIEFFAEESCGWCTPCRVGTALLQQQLEKIIADRGTKADLNAMEALCNTIRRTSRCGLGQTAPNPILSTIRNFPEAYAVKLRKEEFTPRVTLQEALAEAVEVQGRRPLAGEQ
ncbi:MAG: NADH-ubiquinone oxidoreductase-F iron-sulfur binding region domain-containing protein [Alphaproteobacteria bacterium]